MSTISSHDHKIEYRAVIKFFSKSGKSAKEIYDVMQPVFGDSCPTYNTIATWRRPFRSGRESLEDDPRSGRPETALSEEVVSAVKKLVLADRRLKLQQIAGTVGISKKRVGHILHEILGMSKLSARWDPKMLTAWDKERRVATSQEFLEMLEEEGEGLFDRILTVDETYIHAYDPESKRESMQW